MSFFVCSLCIFKVAGCDVSDANAVNQSTPGPGESPVENVLLLGLGER